MYRTLRNHSEFKYLPFFLLVFATVIATQVFKLSSFDFVKSFYIAGKTLLDQTQINYHNQSMQSLPVLRFLFAPFSYFSLDTAKQLFLAFQLIVYYSAYAFMLKNFTTDSLDRWILFLLFLFCSSFYVSLYYGQTSLLAFFLIILIFKNYGQKSSPIYIGALLAILSVIKIPPILLHLFFLYNKNYRIIAFSLSFILFFILVSWISSSNSTMLSYWETVFIKNSKGFIMAYNNQSLYPFISRFFMETKLYAWKLYSIPMLVKSIILLMSFSLFVLSFLNFSYCKSKNSKVMLEKFKYSIVICLLLLILPVTWNHYLVFSIFPFYTFYQFLRLRFRKISAIFFALSFILVNGQICLALNLKNQTLYQFLEPWLQVKTGYLFFTSAPTVGIISLLILLNLNLNKTINLKQI